MASPKDSQQPRTPVEGLGGRKSDSPTDRLRQYLGLTIDQGKRAESKELRPVESKREERPSDRFEQPSRLSRFRESIQRRVQSGWVFQTFRLAGTDRIVHDRRDERASPRGESRESARARPGASSLSSPPSGRSTHAAEKEFVIRKGSLDEVQEKNYQNYFGNKDLSHQPGNPVVKQVQRLLALFEKVLLFRFEEGGQIEQPQAEGMTELPKKNAAQWKEFFAPFWHRTVKREISLSEADKLLLRGVVKQSGSSDMATLISDIHLTSGKTEKFIRLQLALQKLLGQMELEPGMLLDKQWLGKMNGDSITYLAIASAESELRFENSPKELQGQFLSKKYETIAAEKLGLVRDPESPLDPKTMHPALHGRRRGGLFALLSSLFARDKEVIEDEVGRFVPWYHWDRQSRTGFRRWFTLVFGPLIFIILAIAIWGLIRFFSS